MSRIFEGACPACGGDWDVMNDGAYCFSEACPGESPGSAWSSGHWDTEALVEIIMSLRSGPEQEGGE